MDRARPRRAAADATDQRLDLAPPGALAERGVPGAVGGEQCRHVGEAVVVEPEAVLRHDLSDRVLLGEFAHAMFPPAMSYAAIAREKAAIVERTGLLGEGDVGRQVVERFFLQGFGDAEQRARWLRHLVAVAISEPRVGAHPKLLSTHAEENADGYCI